MDRADVLRLLTSSRPAAVELVAGGREPAPPDGWLGDALVDLAGEVTRVDLGSDWLFETLKAAAGSSAVVIPPWARLREASGPFPKGRTVIGSVIREMLAAPPGPDLYFLVPASVFATGRERDLRLALWESARVHAIASGTAESFGIRGAVGMPLALVHVRPEPGVGRPNAVAMIDVDAVAASTESSKRVAKAVTYLVHRNHSPEFWQLVSRALPDWVERKAMLERWEVEHRAV